MVFPQARQDPLEVVAELVDGLTIIHDDDDIVVVDKPVGVAVHPSMGWTGPTVVGHLRAAGYRIATGGAPERQGIVQRLDVGTSGRDGDRQERARLLACSRTPSGTARSTRSTTRSCRAIPIRWRARSTPRSGGTPARTGSSRSREDGKHSVTHYETLEAHRFASLLEVHLETGRTHQIRVHMAALEHPCVGDLTYGADPTLAKRLGLERQWLHAVRLGFEHPGTGEQVEYESAYPADLAHALEVIRGAH